MITFIKTKFKISDDQTNIDKYRLSANITINLTTNRYYKIYDDKAIISIFLVTKVCNNDLL